MIELERTYLAKRLPKNLHACTSKEIVDVYIPKSFAHPKIRIRKNGDAYELTKKDPVHGTDSSEQLEQTIHLTKEEFEALARLPGKKVAKKRYYYPFNGRTAEIDVFHGAVKGLVLVDFEFSSADEKNAFQMPDFCLADVTQEAFAAGGKLCGKSYKDIERKLRQYAYKRLILK